MDNQKLQYMSKIFSNLVLVVALILLGYVIKGGMPNVCAAELPELVDISDLQDNEKLDGKRIVVEGWVRDGVELLTRRREAVYYKLLLGTSKDDTTIEVIVTWPIVVEALMGDRVIVQGYYRLGGRAGGMLQDGDFIAAQDMVEDYGFNQ